MIAKCKCRKGLGAAVAAFLLTHACLPGADFSSAWPEGIDRVWAGPDYYANCLQDWRVRGGRLECVEARPNFPLRTVHLLTRSLRPAQGNLKMSVVTWPVDATNALPRQAWAGFLIGAGGEQVDYRITAMVHHKPAPDGGLLAVMDGQGKVAFRDNSRPAGGGNLWSIGGGIKEEDVPELEPSGRRGDGFKAGQASPVVLELEAKPSGNTYTLILTARLAENKELVSQATVKGVPPEQVDGGMALVSHRGPEGSRTGFWFRDWKVSGSKVAVRRERQFGPILCAQHTLSRGVLKLTAQMPPLGSNDTRTAELQLRYSEDEPWKIVDESELVEGSCTVPFRVEGWDGQREAFYRVAYDLRIGELVTHRHYWEGKIRAVPAGKEEFVVAAFTGHKVFTGGLQWNHQGIWFPHNELVAAVRQHRPDLLFFSGDQIYEGDLTPIHGDSEEELALDYLYKWFRWCWAFGDLVRDLPTVCIPDDHDVYHGNLWGAGGKKAKEGPGLSDRERQDSGGYKRSAWFVNNVHRTQTSHLPDPYDPTPVEQGISVYYTRLEYAGMSFAILADRQWKSSPTVMLPEGKVVNGWFQNPDFDPASRADVPGAVLLGERQLDFLRHWSTEWTDGAWMKVVLSQTIFANVATLPAPGRGDDVVPGLPFVPPGEYPENDVLVADADSNGWPQSGRNRALREMRRGFAFHIAGDQHLGSTVHYGVDGWRDAGLALCVPSIANTWPRRWFPPYPGYHRRLGAPLYTGDYQDGFGNYVTVHAVSNPGISGREPANLHDRAPGYGVARFRRATREIVIECWPRGEDPASPGARQYPGWPITVSQTDNYGKEAWGYLPVVRVEGMNDPVVRVIDETTGQPVYALRICGAVFRPKVFQAGPYTLEVGEPGTERWRRLTSIHAVRDPAASLVVRFEP